MTMIRLQVMSRNSILHEHLCLAPNDMTNMFHHKLPIIILLYALKSIMNKDSNFHLVMLSKIQIHAI